MTKCEFEILRMLMQQPEKLARVAVIAHTLGGRSATDATNLLDVHMSSLRRTRRQGGDPPTSRRPGRGLSFARRALIGTIDPSGRKESM